MSKEKEKDETNRSQFAEVNGPSPARGTILRPVTSLKTYFGAVAYGDFLY